VSAVVELVVDEVVGSGCVGVLTDAVGVKLLVLELDPLDPQPANSRADRAANPATVGRPILHRALPRIVSPRPARPSAISCSVL